MASAPPNQPHHSPTLTVPKSAEEEGRIKHEYRLWLTWAVFVPVLVPVGLWLWSWHKNVGDAFEVNFGGADFLVVAAMMFIVVLQDIEKLPAAIKYQELSWASIVFFVGSVVLWVAYFLCKMDSFQIADRLNSKENPLTHAEVQELHTSLFWYGLMSIAVVFLVSVFSIFIRDKVKNIQLKI
jgi:hypothetical protein